MAAKSSYKTLFSSYGRNSYDFSLNMKDLVELQMHVGVEFLQPVLYKISHNALTPGFLKPHSCGVSRRTCRFVYFI